MKEKRVTAYAMEDILGVPHGSFSNWKRGKGKSFYEQHRQNSEPAWCDHRVSDSWRRETQYALTRQESVLVEGFRKLSDEAKDVVLKTSGY